MAKPALRVRKTCPVCKTGFESKTRTYCKRSCATIASAASEKGALRRATFQQQDRNNFRKMLYAIATERACQKARDQSVK